MDQLLLEAFSTERVLSVLLLLAAAGFGRWFVKSGWPDLMALIRERNEIRRAEIEAARQAEMERARLEAEGDRLLAERLEGLASAFREWVAEIRSLAAIQQTHTNLLIHILERVNGSEVRDALADPEKDFGGGG